MSIPVNEGSLVSLTAYPNPFREELNVRYTLNEPARVRITLINALGAEVAALVDQREDAGTHVHTFHGGNYRLEYGIYFIRYDVQDHHKSHTSIVRLIYIR